MDNLFQSGLILLAGIILGGAFSWWLRSRKPNTRADALKVVHALYVEAMKLPGAAEAKAEAETQLVLENLAANQFAASIAKVTAGGS